MKLIELSCSNCGYLVIMTSVSILFETPTFSSKVSNLLFLVVMVQALYCMTNFPYLLYNTMHSTSSCKQWCCTILCTPPAAASNGAVQYYALHQQLQAMVQYNTMHSTSSCKQWCCTILCTPPAAASNGAV